MNNAAHIDIFKNSEVVATIYVRTSGKITLVFEQNVVGNFCCVHCAMRYFMLEFA